MALSLVRAEPAPPADALAVGRLRLRDFRNYATLGLEPAGLPVVLHGSNGAGKTNLLEAVSMLAPGRGLRGARLAEMDRHGGGPWSLTALVTGREGPLEIATARDAASERRTVRLEGGSARSSASLARHVGMVWLTPAQDRLFQDAPSARRRFLDRLVVTVTPEHARQLGAYERALRERSLMLREGRADPAWLAAIETRLAAAGVAVAAARRDLVAGLARALAEPQDAFPAPLLALAGEVEGWLAEGPALAAEQRLAEALKASRGLDAQTGGAAVGPHRTDLAVRDGETGTAAAQCSTGRQKALLLSIVLAEARLRRERLGELPVMLLDEVAAHLDQQRRGELFEALHTLGAQCWLTGTEPSLFTGLRRRARFLHVHEATVDHDD
ncbi:DNA replication/repair protein RecF [Marinimicrococcus flavescens]|uniref:DNA replication and repair protein RecF n=1 Tax=Marinimicrococcus flavescens TaxID=3031815 RepID=A0AAP3V2M4_9PROT|nr:DNA replication/repair protein RecF [Marinimicrococcus flavescens]